jgi:hypothetical protein
MVVCSASVSIPRARARTLAYARLLICGAVLDRDQPCANSGPCPSVRVPSLQSRRRRDRERHIADYVGEGTVQCTIRLLEMLSWAAGGSFRKFLVFWRAGKWNK